MDLKEKIRDLPRSPGVYRFRDSSGAILYIGKAIDLKKRVTSYFQKKDHEPRIKLLVTLARDVDYIPTSTEAEALIYESYYIKEVRPRFNVSLKDDKSYPYLKLTVKEKYPRLMIVREKKKDRSAYYGPYTSAKLLRQAVDFMRKVFPLRTCNKLPKKTCLNFHIAQCTGPCVNRDTYGTYKEAVADVKLFLSGRKHALLERLAGRMNKYASDTDFERALKVRSQIEALSHVLDEKRHSAPLDGELVELKNVAGIKVVPACIEAFDISNIHGQYAVGSMVSFFNAKPSKKGYRRFRIKTVGDIDDYAMIREVVGRRYKRLKLEGSKMPDLILIDGGLGHLNSALAELKAIGVSIPVISIAKQDEVIFVQGRPGPVILHKDSKALKLVQRVRDEAHRFALSYHRILRAKGVLGEE